MIKTDKRHCRLVVPSGNDAREDTKGSVGEFSTGYTCFHWIIELHVLNYFSLIIFYLLMCIP